MKRTLSLLFLFIYLFLLSLCLSISASDDYEQSLSLSKDLHKVVYNIPYIINNEATLFELITVDYSINDLNMFFGKIPVSERLLYNEAEVLPDYNIHNVNKQFPIECLRQTDKNTLYTVYKVKEGGYYYVFYNPAADLTGYIKPVTDLVVAFSAHISFLNDICDYDIIVENVSTAADVAQINPSLEVVTLLSSRLPSYSLLNDGFILEICYKRNENIKSRNDLTVISKNIISKDIAPSHMSGILPIDIAILHTA